jgi:DNA repair protein RecO (recombination protein O)
VALEKTEALVLRSMKFGETSKIVTFLSRDHGRLKAIAKGVRAARPRFGGALEPFARLELVYYRKNHGDLHLVSQADLIEGFLGLTDDLMRYAFGCGVLEFTERVVGDESEAGVVFDDAIDVLRLMQESDRDALPHLLRAFQMKAIVTLGHAPELYTCTSCGRDAGASVTVSALSGGVLCVSCARNAPNTLRTSQAALGILRAYREEPLREAALRTIDPRVRAEVGRVMEAFLSAQFDTYRGLKSLRMAASLRDITRKIPTESGSLSG